MLQVQGISKTYGATAVLSDVSFVLDEGEHVGLVGPNGAGKSTVFRCIAGHELPDAGTVSFSPPELALGYLEQAFGPEPDQTVGDVLAAAQRDLTDAAAELDRATAALASTLDLDAAMECYADALAGFEAMGGYERARQESVILQGLGLGDVPPDIPINTLSGGQKTRLGLAGLLLKAPGLLLLDEPTNHLDVTGLEWLEGFVQRYRGTVLVVSHDREFLDRTVARILYLDPESHAVRSYPGNYSAFAAARARERENQRERWKTQQEYVERVSADIAALKGKAFAIERATTSRQPNVRRLARKMAGLAISRERKLERYLGSDERVDKPRATWGLKLDFGAPKGGSRDALILEHIDVGYPGTSPLLRDVNLTIRHGERVAIVGANGAGKTTLLRTIDGRLAPLAGRVRAGASVRIGVLTQEQETLDPDRTVLDTVLAARAISEADARNFLHYFLFSGDSVYRRVSACSLGERSRLQLAQLVLSGCDLLLLDEPLNFLDVEGREHFEAALVAFSGTVIAVAHDRAFLRRFAERVVEVENGAARAFEGGYEAYVSQRSRGSPRTRPDRGSPSSNECS
jgi:ATP-binding cassette subfamily F protein 3